MATKIDRNLFVFFATHNYLHKAIPVLLFRDKQN